MILINGRFFSRRPTGVDRFAIEVITAIDNLLAVKDSAVGEMDFRILLPPGVKPERQFLHIPIKTLGRLTGQLWEQLELPQAVPRDGLLLNFCNTGPVLTRQQIVAIHDAATVKMPMAYSRAFRYWYCILLPMLGLISRKVLTVSEFSKQEIASSFMVPRDKISVVKSSGEHICRFMADTKAIQRFGLSKRPYVLAVSSLAAHKNFRLILDTITHLENPPFDIAIAGGVSSLVFGKADKKEYQHVKWLGYVSDTELRALYESAMCFVFPSLYEGFGLPPLEAMHCGCPVLASLAASIPEVCGDAALYFDPYKAEELAVLLMRVANDSSLCAELIQKGYARAAEFSWDKTAREIVSQISTVCNLQHFHL